MIQQSIIPTGDKSDLVANPNGPVKKSNSLDIFFGDVKVSSFQPSDTINTITGDTGNDKLANLVHITPSYSKVADQKKNKAVLSSNGTIQNVAPDLVAVSVALDNMLSNEPEIETAIPKIPEKSTNLVAPISLRTTKQNHYPIQKATTQLLKRINFKWLEGFSTGGERKVASLNQEVTFSKVPLQSNPSTTNEVPSSNSIKSVVNDSRKLIPNMKLTGQYYTSNKQQLFVKNDEVEGNNNLSTQSTFKQKNVNNTFPAPSRNADILRKKKTMPEVSLKKQSLSGEQINEEIDVKSPGKLKVNISSRAVKSINNSQIVNIRDSKGKELRVSVGGIPLSTGLKNDQTIQATSEDLIRSFNKIIDRPEIATQPTKWMNPIGGQLLQGIPLPNRTEIPQPVMFNAIVKALDFIKQSGHVRANVIIDTGSWGLMDVEMQKAGGRHQIHIFVESEGVQSAIQRVIPIITENLIAKGIALSAVEVYVNDSYQQASFTKQRKKGHRKTWHLKIRSTENDDSKVNFPLNRYYGYNTIEILA